MRHLDQIYRHGVGPRGVPCGDCFRTCLAMLLDAPDPEYVPHFVDMTMGMRRGGYHTQRLARQWLRDEYGLDLVSVRAEDLPSFEVALFDGAPCKTNPLGAKGCGESGTVAGTPTLVNAVVDALASRGVADLEMPITPEKLWRACSGQ